MNRNIYNKYKRAYGYFQKGDMELQAEFIAGSYRVYCVCGSVGCKNTNLLHHKYSYIKIWVPFIKYRANDNFKKLFYFVDATHALNPKNGFAPKPSIVKKFVKDNSDIDRDLLLKYYISKEHQKDLFLKKNHIYKDAWSHSLEYDMFNSACLDFFNSAFTKKDSYYREIISKLAYDRLSGGSPRSYVFH